MSLLMTCYWWMRRWNGAARASPRVHFHFNRGNRIPSSLYCILFQGFLCTGRPLLSRWRGRETNSRFVIIIFFTQRPLLSLSFLTKAPLFQANNISLSHPQKQAYFFPKMSPIVTKWALHSTTCKTFRSCITAIEHGGQMSKNSSNCEGNPAGLIAHGTARDVREGLEPEVRFSAARWESAREWEGTGRKTGRGVHGAHLG